LLLSFEPLVLLPCLTTSFCYTTSLLHHIVSLLRCTASLACQAISLSHCTTLLPRHIDSSHYLSTSLPLAIWLPFHLRYLLTPPFVVSMPRCLVLVGTSSLAPLLQRGAWSLEKQTLQQPLEKVFFFLLLLVFFFLFFFC
jgi:hypothetical protein